MGSGIARGFLKVCGFTPSGLRQLRMQPHVPPDHRSEQTRKSDAKDIGVRASTRRNRKTPHLPLLCIPEHSVMYSYWNARQKNWPDSLSRQAGMYRSPVLQGPDESAPRLRKHRQDSAAAQMSKSLGTQFAADVSGRWDLG